MPYPVGTRIEIRLPDDFHHHCRDGAKTAAVLQHAAERFGRCLMMPNLKPPITTAADAIQYKQHILNSLLPPKQDSGDSLDANASSSTTTTLEPLMTLYLTDHTTADDIAAAVTVGVVAVKYYPAGATTNSAAGVTDIKKCYGALEAMTRLGMMLCIHSEVTHGDLFDRELFFIEEIIKPLVADHPNLKITMEHISTKEAVEYVTTAPDNVKATITCHHLLYNRNDMLVGGIRPHLYCLPILKAEPHRQALVAAVISGSPKFFLGTDSAPHSVSTKESWCGCAGVYTAHAAVELYAEVFDDHDALHRFEDFCSSYGADHYGLPRSTRTIVLEKTAWTVPHSYNFGHDGDRVRPLRAGEEVAWRILSSSVPKNVT